MQNAVIQLIKITPVAYLSTCLFTTALLTFYDQDAEYKPANFALLSVLLFSFILIWKRESLGALLKRDWGSLCLYAFAAWLCLRTATHDDPHIRATFISAIITSIGIGAALGFIAFSGSVDRSIGDSASRTNLVSATIGSGVIIFVFLIYIYNSRSDFFLLKNAFKESVLYYQLFGNYLYLLLVCVFSSFYLFLLRCRANCFAAFVICVVSVSSVSLFLSQLGGANKATVLIGLTGGAVVFFAVFDNTLRSRQGWAGRMGIACLVGTIALLGAWKIAADQQPMRMFGFQPIPRFPLSFYTPETASAPVDSKAVEETFLNDVEGELDDVEKADEKGSFSNLNNSSVSSRVNIWEDYAWKQLKVAPMFGDLAADRIVTGTRGEYLHSLASIQTHLGLVGTLLLAGFLSHRLWRLWRMPRQLVLKVAAPVIIVVAAASSFFTWMPFWFVVGALYAPDDGTS